jgi:capsular exopolysaccharide synthesis family protein
MAEQKLASDAGAIQREMEALNAVELEYKRLEAAAQSRKDLNTQLMVRQKEAQLQAEARANNVRILDAALVPERPVSPRLFVNLSVALLIALFGGIGLALLIDSLDSSVKNQEQLEKEFGLTFLGLVPSMRPQRRKKGNRFEPTGPIDPDRYVLDYPHSTAAECVRTVRTNLLFMAPERELRKLLITSAGPREGKTSTSVNIAATMAMSGNRVLLIDSDLRRPRIHRIFDLENNRGLSNLVLDPERDLATVAQPSGVENLDIMCSGPIPPNPAELLHTASFHRVVERLLERYDRIIFDSPPVCAVTDALILGNVCDGAVLVVRAGQTSREMVKKASRLLADVKVNILGALLNNVDVSRRGYGQYYYQEYRSTGYGADGRPAEGTPPQG